MRYTPAKTLRFVGEARRRLKSPLGELIEGSPEETRGALLEKLRGVRGLIIAVGDVVSRELRSLGVRVDAYIVDGRVERRAGEGFEAAGSSEMWCRNEAGSISPEAYAAVAAAMERGGGVVLRVEGEEDLLGLVAIAEAPLGSAVVYGQPGVGVVVVRIDEEKIGEALEIMRLAAS